MRAALLALGMALALAACGKKGAPRPPVPAPAEAPPPEAPPEEAPETLPGEPAY